MTPSEWTEMWKSDLMDMVLEGMCADRDTRGRLVCNMPGKFALKLQEMYRTAQPAPVTRPEPARPASTNGTPPANGHANGAAKPAVAGRINGAGR